MVLKLEDILEAVNTSHHIHLGSFDRLRALPPQLVAGCLHFGMVHLRCRHFLLEGPGHELHGSGLRRNQGNTLARDYHSWRSFFGEIQAQERRCLTKKEVDCKSHKQAELNQVFGAKTAAVLLNMKVFRFSFCALRKAA